MLNAPSIIPCAGISIVSFLFSSFVRHLMQKLQYSIVPGLFNKKKGGGGEVTSFD
jgi:hypothetical protein